MSSFFYYSAFVITLAMLVYTNYVNFRLVGGGEWTELRARIFMGALAMVALLVAAGTIAWIAERA